MKYELPQWLNDWITINKDQEGIDISLKEEKDEEKRVAVIEARWIGKQTEVSNVQINMNLTDPTIQLSWKPHLSPEEDMIIGDLSFRSPALIFEKGKKLFSLIPDIDFIEENRKIPHIMDYVEPERRLYYGLSHYEKKRHVYYTRKEEKFLLEPNQTLFKYYLVQWTIDEGARDFQTVTGFLWERFGKKRMTKTIDRSESIVETSKELEKYAKYTYDWAFNRWESVVWQEFELDQKQVGANVFIVRGIQTPGLGNENKWREKKSIWNQAWFSSLRSAYGYRLWGEYWREDDLIRRSELTKNLALSAPQTNGLFPSVYTAGKNNDWETGQWEHSDRRPSEHEDYYHLLDMSWTCLWMLKWWENIESDSQLLDYAVRYAHRLIELQNSDGSFPAWIHEKTGEKSPYLKQSAETALHVWFLTKLYRLTDQEIFLFTAKAAIDFILNETLPKGQWEDFETYWSCSIQWDKKKYGEKDVRSGLYNQCNFSIYWTVEALKELYLATNERRYLNKGEKVLAELSLFQSIWNPTYLSVPVLGGFGVMTSDDEWNDARQSLFALTYADYFDLTGKEEYKYRSIWAMKASFYMMYCPENQKVKKLYEEKFPHFGKKDYGFEMENVHHGEFGSYNHVKAGEFTIFDWGNGSSSASLGMLLFNK